MTIFCFLLALFPGHLAADSQEILKAWQAPETRREVGFLVYSYYAASQLSPSSEDSDGDDTFSEDLESFLQSPGLEGDCALAQALWYDLGDDCAEEIENEIMDRGAVMLDVLALGLEEYRRFSAPPGGSNECDIVRLSETELRERYQECIDGIRQDQANRSL